MIERCADITHSRSSVVRHHSFDRRCDLRFLPNSNAVGYAGIAPRYVLRSQSFLESVDCFTELHTSGAIPVTAAYPKWMRGHWLLCLLLIGYTDSFATLACKTDWPSYILPITIGCTGVLNSVCSDGQSFVRTR